jgi:two-component system, chemotaxis family, chemotaxis protein CheY
MSRTVLICDDAMFMRTLISRTLTAAGFTVVGEATTGAEAVKKYEELKPDLVTMDVVMPELGGIDAVRQITSADHDACIVVCSAMGQAKQVTQALEAGATGFLVKPFNAEQLVAQVEESLGRRAARSAR